MRRRLKLIVPIVLVVALGAAYKLVLAKPSAEAKPRVPGQVYVLPKDFLLNLSDGRFAKLDVALVMKPGAEVAPAGGEGAAPAPTDGVGTLPQEALVRDIVTNVVTDVPGRRLISRSGRRALKKRILRAIQRKTDVEATRVLFTDVAVQ